MFLFSFIPKYTFNFFVEVYWQQKQQRVPALFKQIAIFLPAIFKISVDAIENFTTTIEPVV